MKTGILYTALICVTSAGFVGWRVHAMRTQGTSHFEIVEDPSISHPEGCESLLGLAEQALSTEGVSSNSTLTILVIGNEATANEPWQLGRFPIPRIRTVLEGRTANARQRQEVLRDIWNKCQTIHRTSISPIFLGVTQAIADLRAQGCNEASHCGLFVNSDLEENVEPSVKKSINGATNVKRNLPPLIENGGIEISFCGLAVTAGRIVDPSGREMRSAPIRNAGHEDRLKEVWISLFTKPELVRFEPYCPKLADQGVDASSGSSAKGPPEL